MRCWAVTGVGSKGGRTRGDWKSLVVQRPMCNKKPAAHFGQSEWSLLEKPALSGGAAPRARHSPQVIALQSVSVHALNRYGVTSSGDFKILSKAPDLTVLA